MFCTDQVTRSLLPLSWHSWHDWLRLSVSCHADVQSFRKQNIQCPVSSVRVITIAFPCKYGQLEYKRAGLLRYGQCSAVEPSINCLGLITLISQNYTALAPPAAHNKTRLIKTGPRNCTAPIFLVLMDLFWRIFYLIYSKVVILIIYFWYKYLVYSFFIKV